MQTFTEFMEGAAFPNAAYVKQEGFSSFYIKKGRRYLEGKLYDNILVLSNIEARRKGRGTLTKFIIDFRAKYKPKRNQSIISNQKRNPTGILLSFQNCLVLPL